MNSWQVGSVSLGDNYSQGNYANAQKTEQARVAAQAVKQTTAEIAADFSEFVDSAIHAVDVRA